MKGDFSRDTFSRFHHFSRVMMQQGRVQLDADWNEQVSILLHYLRAMAKDLFGPFGGPGFKIARTQGKSDLTISPGNYYVDGILCENEDLDEFGQPVSTTYLMQPYFVPEKNELPTSYPYMVYLDLWEQHVTDLETTHPPFTLNTPNIREVALNGPDTATRARVVWQVKVESITLPTSTDEGPAIWSDRLNAGWTGEDTKEFQKWWESSVITKKQPVRERGMLKAMAMMASGDNKEPCITPPEASYRGLENQLYRVEIHRGGPAWNGQKENEGGNQSHAATFTISKDNGSKIYRVLQLGGQTVTLEHLGHDSSSTLAKDDWVEIVDDDLILRNRERVMFQVFSVNPDESSLTLKASEVPLPTYEDNHYREKHVLLRRWDHKNSAVIMADTQVLPVSDGALLVREGQDTWIALEDGVQICFQPALGADSHTYRAGDYWLIPARVATRDVEWPRDKDQKPIAQLPHGVDHHYAPLAIVTDAGVKAPWRDK